MISKGGRVISEDRMKIIEMTQRIIQHEIIKELRISRHTVQVKNSNVGSILNMKKTGQASKREYQRKLVKFI